MVSSAPTALSVRKEELMETLRSFYDHSVYAEAYDAMGREVYNRSLNGGQAGVFWTEYNLQKSKLERDIKLGPVARSMIQRIAKANGNLA